MVEATVLETVQCGFESHPPYHKEVSMKLYVLWFETEEGKEKYFLDDTGDCFSSSDEALEFVQNNIQYFADILGNNFTITKFQNTYYH